MQIQTKIQFRIEEIIALNPLIDVFQLDFESLNVADCLCATLTDC